MNTDYTKFEDLSPFEIKDELIRLANMDDHPGTHVFLNAGRGNPNWIATKARGAFFVLGQFALLESRLTFEHAVGLAGMPQKPGIWTRFTKWVDAHPNDADIQALGGAMAFANSSLGFDKDAFLFEMVDSIIGDNYPVPGRALRLIEQVTHRYLEWAMCGDRPPKGRFDLFHVEGGTAAMTYLFKALKNARLLNAGDTIAIGTPIFTPYLEMPGLEDYQLKSVYITMEQEDGFQLTQEDLTALLDPKVKAFFIVNPGNPTSVALSESVVEQIAELVETKRPDLIILTDDVYGTFVRGFRSIMARLPHNTIGVYSYSKYFGCTGWRLGVIALHETNILDEKIADLPAEAIKALDVRYGSLTPEPAAMKFIDRVVADSRDVALNHTAGLSLPQQVMMALFSLVELMDHDKVYQTACIEIIDKRFRNVVHGMDIEVKVDGLYDRYYGLVDYVFWLEKIVGKDVTDWIKENVHPLDISFRLAREHGIVLLNGDGFHAPNWSARISFANLDDDAYETIGKAVRAVAAEYVEAHRASLGKI